MRTHIFQLFPPVSHIKKQTQRRTRKHTSPLHTRARAAHACTDVKFEACLPVCFSSAFLWTNDQYAFLCCKRISNRGSWKLWRLDSGNSSLCLVMLPWAWTARTRSSLSTNTVFMSRSPPLKTIRVVSFFYFMYKRVQQFPRNIYTYEGKGVLSCSTNIS